MSDHLKAFTDEILEPSGGKDPEHSEMIARIRFAVEQNAVQNAKRNPTDSASELVLKNLVETGFFFNSIHVVIDMITAYNQRFTELCDQEAEFWNLSHRAPNYYARMIALRFARFFAGERGASRRLALQVTARTPQLSTGVYWRRFLKYWGYGQILKTLPNGR